MAVAVAATLVDMQHTRHSSTTRTDVRVAVAPATSVEVASLFAGLISLLLIVLLLL